MGKHVNVKSPRRYGDGHGPGYKNPPGGKWAPGQSGNPSGGRKEKYPRALSGALADTVQKVMETDIPMVGGDSMPILEGLVRRICGDGLQNHKAAIKAIELFLRVDAILARDGLMQRAGLSPEDIALVAERLGTEARERGEASGEVDEEAGDE